MLYLTILGIVVLKPLCCMERLKSSCNQACIQEVLFREERLTIEGLHSQIFMKGAIEFYADSLNLRFEAGRVKSTFSQNSLQNID